MRRPSIQIHFGQLGHYHNVSYSCCRFRNSRRDFDDGRGLGGLLQLLRAAAVHDVLSAAIRRAAIPHRRRDRDGVARRHGRAPHAGAVPHRDGAADRDGGAAERSIRAHPAAIRDAPARRDGLAGLFLLRPGADGLRVLRILNGRDKENFARCSSSRGRRVFFCGKPAEARNGGDLEPDLATSNALGGVASIRGC